MRRRFVAGVPIAFAIVMTSCASFTTPRAETLANVTAMPLAHLVPGQFELELTTSGLTGTFDAVCAVDGASFRVQVFPDVGGKVFDVVVGADAVTAEWPGGRYDAKAPLAAAEPHLALVLAALFGELLAPVTAQRVLGERIVGDGAVDVQLRPALGSGEVIARLAAGGKIVSYHITLGWIAFDLAADGSFGGRGATGRLRARGGG